MAVTSPGARSHPALLHQERQSTVDHQRQHARALYGQRSPQMITHPGNEILFSLHRHSSSPPTMGPSQREPAHNENPCSNYRTVYFIPAEGIDFDVLASDLPFYLGPDASVKQGNYYKDSHRTGYYVQSTTVLLQAMIADLKADSTRWRQEQRSNRVRKYVASKTHRRRLREGSTGRDFSPASHHQRRSSAPWRSPGQLQPKVPEELQLVTSKQSHVTLNTGQNRYEPFDFIKLSGDSACEGNVNNPDYGSHCPLLLCPPKCRVNWNIDPHQSGTFKYGVCKGSSDLSLSFLKQAEILHKSDSSKGKVDATASTLHTCFSKESEMPAESCLQACRGLAFQAASFPPSPSLDRLCIDGTNVNSRDQQVEMKNLGMLLAPSGEISLRSLLDVVSYLTNVIHDLAQDGEEVDAVYGECMQLKSVLQGLEAFCKNSLLDIHFILEDEHQWKRAGHSLERARRLLDCIGISRRCRHFSETVTRQGYEQSRGIWEKNICYLKQALEEKARGGLLILICKPLGGFIVEEALSKTPPVHETDWLLGRIGGILLLDTIRLAGPQRRYTCVGLENCINSAFLLPVVEEPMRSIYITDQPLVQTRASRNLQRRIEYVKIHRVLGNSGVSVLESSLTALVGSHRSFAWPTTRRSFIETWCGEEDFEDCVLWSLLRLIDGVQSPHSYRTLAQQSPLTASVGGGDTEPLSSLRCLLSGDDPQRASLVLRSLRWIAFSRRALHVDELFAAVVTSTKFHTKLPPCKGNHNETIVARKSTLLNSCAGFVEIGQDGSVRLSDADLRSFILSPASSTLEPCQVTDIHEMIAVVCLRHMQCLHNETMIRPWLLTGAWLVGDLERCRIRKYATTFWHEHFRLAEGHSRSLPFILDSIIRLALADDEAENTTQSVKSDLRVNYGLWICSVYDFEVMGKAYLQMGADVGVQHICGETLLHAAAANASTSVLKLLVDRGVNASYRMIESVGSSHPPSFAASPAATATSSENGDRMIRSECSHISGTALMCPEKFTPLHLAAMYGNAEIAKLLVEAGIDVDATTSGTTDTALHLAVSTGDGRLVRYLIENGANPNAPNFALETPLQIAIEERLESIVKLLVPRDTRIPAESPADQEFTNNILCERSYANSVDKSDRPYPETDKLMQGSQYLMTPTLPESLVARIIASQEEFAEDEFSGAESDGWCLVTKCDAEDGQLTIEKSTRQP